MINWIISAHILLLSVILLRQIFRERISCRLRYLLWGVVLIRLLIPVSLGTSPLSVLNLLPANGVRSASVVLNENPAGPQTAGSDASGNSQAAASSVSGTSGNLRVAVSDSPQADAAVNRQSARVDRTPDGRPAGTSDGILGEMSGEEQEEERAGASGGFLAALAILADILPWLWLAGSLVMSAGFLFFNLRLAGRLKRSRTVYPHDRMPLPVYVTEEVTSPCLFGLLHPAIYLTPAAVAPGVRTDYVLLHEQCHFERGDSFWTLARILCLILWWWSPLVWVGARLSRRDGELACDEAVLARIGEENALLYGKVLVDMIQPARRTVLLGATAMSRHASDMKERLLRLTRRSRPRRGAALAVLLLTFAVALGACTGAVSSAGGANFSAVAGTSAAESPAASDSQSEPGSTLAADSQSESGNMPASDFAETTAASGESSAGISAAAKSLEELPPPTDGNEWEGLIHDSILLQDSGQEDDDIMPASRQLRTEAHRIMGLETQGDAVTFYMWVSTAHYAWQPGRSIGEEAPLSDSHTPVALTLAPFSPERAEEEYPSVGGYQILEYRIPDDGPSSDPSPLWGEMLLDSNGYTQELAQACREQAREQAADNEAFYQSLQSELRYGDEMDFLSLYVKCLNICDYAAICALTDDLPFDAARQKEWSEWKKSGLLFHVTGDFATQPSGHHEETHHEEEHHDSSHHGGTSQTGNYHASYYEADHYAMENCETVDSFTACFDCDIEDAGSSGLTPGHHTCYLDVVCRRDEDGSCYWSASGELYGKRDE